jgi:hypothetical protein
MCIRCTFWRDLIAVRFPLPGCSQPTGPVRGIRPGKITNLIYFTLSNPVHYPVRFMEA